MNTKDPVSDVSKVANRKRMGEDVEKLREKVSRETSKIIKLRVAQDTAYWDLKEKLQAVEANHERLQANMVDVQMQHEAISASYQAELRRRPETLNKLTASRAIADTLEENAARLRDSLRRQNADCAALQHAYAGAAQRAVLAVAGAQGAVRAQRASFDGAVERERADADRARADAVRAAAAAAGYCQQAESARREAAGAAERAAAANDEAKLLRENLQAVRRDLDQATARCEILTEEKERLKGREDNTARLLREAEIERQRLSVELQSTRDQLERDDVELDAVRAEVARLEGELKTECARREADLEAERSARARAEAEQRAAAERAEAEWSVERETLIAELRAAREALARLETDTGGERARLEAEREEAEGRAAAAEREGRARLEAALAAGEERAGLLLAELEGERERGRAAAAALVARADTISDLMRDVTREAEARARAEDELKARDATLRKHEDDLVDRMKIINDLRAEKERLQEKMHAMQGTIDNIQTELTRDVQTTTTRVAAVREPAERDGGGTETLDFSFLMSESSGDSMSLDAGEVERRMRGTAGGGGREQQVANISGAANRSSTTNISIAANRSGTVKGSGAANRSSTVNSSSATNRSGTANRSSTANRYFFKTKRLDAKRK